MDKKLTQIFISHSAKDEKIRGFFANIFASSNVRAVFKEIEGFSSNSDSEEIEDDIRNSSAVFILLGENVQNLKHTRDWVVWESGVAKTLDKEIWVFEPLSSYGKIDIVIPDVNHYIPFFENDNFIKYFLSIINSYDESEVLPSAVVGSTIGILGGIIIDTITHNDLHFGLGTFFGGVIGGTLGLIYGDHSHTKPTGIRLNCANCTNSYKIHSKIKRIRCPICNTVLEISWSNIETEDLNKLIKTIPIADEVLKKINPIQNEFDHLRSLLMKLLISRAKSSLSFALKIKKLEEWQNYFGLACEYKDPIDDTNHYFLDGDYYIIPNSATLRRVSNDGKVTQLITKNDIPEEITETVIKDLEKKIDPFLIDIKNYVEKEHKVLLR